MPIGGYILFFFSLLSTHNPTFTLFVLPNILNTKPSNFIYVGHGL